MPVSNPQSLKMKVNAAPGKGNFISLEIVKVPVRLHEKILDCEEPVVGLDFIVELLPESDPEVHFLFV